MTAIVITSPGDTTNSPQRTISGTYVPQKIAAQYSYVRIQDGADGGFFNIGDVMPDVTSGHFSIGVTLGGMTLSRTPGGGFMAGAEGVHSIVAQALDPSGNLLESSAPMLFTLKRNAPVLTIAPVPAGTANPTLALSGTIDDAQCRVSIVDGGMTLTEVTAASNGHWSASVTLSGAGSHSLYATATDQAGNRGESPRVTTVLSLAAPTVTLAGATPVSGSPGLYTLSGTIDAGDLSNPIAILDGTAEINTVMAADVKPNGSWSTVVTLAAGAHSLTARATNAAGTGASAACHLQVPAH